MHTVLFAKDEKTRTLIMKASGHARADDDKSTGVNEVCASASILAYTLAQNVQYWGKAQMCNGHPTIKIDGDKAEVEIRLRMRNQSCFAQALNGFLTIYIGYVLLAHNYPDRVQVNKL